MSYRRVRPPANLARRKLAAFPAVEILETDFESWVEEEQAFRLAFSATAWHHVDPAVRYMKARRALEPDGVLAIYANSVTHFFEEGQDA